MSTKMKTIALTIGDPNGIGPEIAVKAAADLRDGHDVRVVLVGDEHVIRHYLERVTDGARLQAFTGGAPVDKAPADRAILFHAVDALPSGAFVPGKIDAAAGRATVAYVEAAIGLVQIGRAHV